MQQTLLGGQLERPNYILNYSSSCGVLLYVCFYGPHIPFHNHTYAQYRCREIASSLILAAR